LRFKIAIFSDRGVAPLLNENLGFLRAAEDSPSSSSSGRLPLNRITIRRMVDLVRLLLDFVLDCLRSSKQLRAENAALRHQLNILRRKAPKKPKLSNSDRVLLVWLYRLFPGIADAITIVRPETLIRWHRAGFRAWWRWKSRNPGGRPKVDRELQDLIHRMCNENPLWGAPRIHGELLKLGLTVAQSTVSKYMLRGRRPPSQSWKTFLHNHADGIAAVDFLVVPTLTFERLFAFVVLGLGRRMRNSGAVSHGKASVI
jgi:hypothetical protein